MDFVLFDDDGEADAVGEEDDSLYGGYGDSEGAGSYLPWTSPSTRLRKNELFIEMFSQAYNSAEDKTAMTTDPGDAEAASGLSEPTPPRGIQVPNQGGDHGQFVGDMAIKIESPVMAVKAITPRKRNHEPVEADPAETGRSSLPAGGNSLSGNHKAQAGQAMPTGQRARVFPDQSGDGDDCFRPKKKSKPDPSEDFTDKSMPDIFHYAHPQIYNRNRSDKYSPCHTVHREISTLVAGVCRCCWQTFNDRQAFDAHVSLPCERVSKGKREKWRVLYQSFTPLLNSATALPGPGQSEPTKEQQRGMFSGHLNGPLVSNDDNVCDEAGTPPTSVPSPGLLSSVSFVGGGSLVPAEEHRKLQEEHRTLRERHQQLERVTQVLLARQLMQDKLTHEAATGPHTGPSGVGTSHTSYPSASPDGSERDSLVQHMDSQSTNVDVYRFMEEMEDMEGPRQSLPRMNSGLSTASRSTIYHVPLSPPPRRAELPAHKSDGSASQAHQPPPPSIPDSGYGSDQRRGSLAELLPGAGTGEQADTRPMMPPSNAAEKSQDDPAFNQGLSWGDNNPFAKPLAAATSTPSPQNSQQLGFIPLPDQETTAHYEDAAFHLFYPDPNLQSQSSPPAFTFEYPSQLE
ncbi:5e866058-37d7-4381-a2d3-dfaba0a65ff5 [Thermothielavioides terrestris]|uniref:5e866058-37d7-4381-a2d3-dfaba0a65ff5 n=1 Tax=Thermothielavioides terrestris TaxID=2587410 RepID=A0A3S4ANZ1_9PEZI|nr:5e866058-37d7-4381-a2d3-dfaba0a65ff5 [Thermothielavioides terrestris]